MYTVYFDKEKYKECKDSNEASKALDTLLPIILTEMGLQVFDENGVEVCLSMIMKSGGVC